MPPPQTPPTQGRPCPFPTLPASTPSVPAPSCPVPVPTAPARSATCNQFFPLLPLVPFFFKT